jgi:NADPH-dependent curcumin reductase CurA
MRGRMNEGKSYVPQFEIGKPLEGSAVGEVIESHATGFKPGDIVTSSFGWREYFVSNHNVHCWMHNNRRKYETRFSTSSSISKW